MPGRDCARDARARTGREVSRRYEGVQALSPRGLTVQAAFGWSMRVVYGGNMIVGPKVPDIPAELVRDTELVGRLP